jgi:hypothetical protein
MQDAITNLYAGVPVSDLDASLIERAPGHA